MRKSTGNIVRNMLILTGISLYSTSAMAGVYATINVTGPASQFDSIPTAASVSADPGATQIDPVELKIANDSQYLYLFVGYSSASNNPNTSGLFLAIDSDNNPATGDAIYGSTLIGSNLGFQNDFPFTQTSSSFNSGGSVSSATATANNFGSIYLASPYNTPTDYQIISLPLDLVQSDGSAGGYSGSVFPSSFTLELYTSPGSGNAVVVGPAAYTLATAPVPEPVSVGMIGLAALPFFRRRRRA